MPGIYIGVADKFGQDRETDVRGVRNSGEADDTTKNRFLDFSETIKSSITSDLRDIFNDNNNFITFRPRRYTPQT